MDCFDVKESKGIKGKRRKRTMSFPIKHTLLCKAIHIQRFTYYIHVYMCWFKNKCNTWNRDKKQRHIVLKIQKDISAPTLIKFRNKAQLYLSLLNYIRYFLIVYFVKNFSVVQLYNCTISTKNFIQILFIQCLYII